MGIQPPVKAGILKRMLVLILVLCQLLFVPVNSTAIDLPQEYFAKAIQLLEENYIREIPGEHSIKAGLKGLFGGLDEYTAFYTLEDAKAYLSLIEGKYAGIGAVLVGYGDYTVIYKVLPGSPAEKAGLLAGDKITAVNGVSCVGIPMEETADMLKGEEDTGVILEILRKDYKDLLQFEICREVISVNPLEYKIFGDVGCLKIAMFNNNAGKHFRSVLEAMDKVHINKLVVDLRDNPGGEVLEAVAVARELVPQGLITRVEFGAKDGENMAFYSELVKPKYDIVVLVNGGTASASELLAGAIQDTAAGLILGTRTFGKAKVQNMFALLSPSAYERYHRQYGIETINAYDLLEQYDATLAEEDIIGWAKITTGQYFTPLGRKIDQRGLEPDIEVAEGMLLTNGMDIYNIDELRKTEITWPGGESIDVINAEKTLLALGYQVDWPDMSLDKKTSLALKEYQNKKGLKPSGILDLKTQAALNRDLDRLIVKTDRQLSKALELLW